MKTEVRFVSKTDTAVFTTVKLGACSAEQFGRLDQAEIRIEMDPYIEVSAALIVLLGINHPIIKVRVPSGAINWAARAIDDGTQHLQGSIDDSAIIQAWLSAGAPLEWDGRACSDDEPRKKIIRDAAGRFTRTIF